MWLTAQETSLAWHNDSVVLWYSKTCCQQIQCMKPPLKKTKRINTELWTFLLQQPAVQCNQSFKHGSIGSLSNGIQETQQGSIHVHRRNKYDWKPRDVVVAISMGREHMQWLTAPGNMTLHIVVWSTYWVVMAHLEEGSQVSGNNSVQFWHAYKWTIVARK